MLVCLQMTLADIMGFQYFCKVSLRKADVCRKKANAQEFEKPSFRQNPTSLIEKLSFFPGVGGGANIPF